MITTRTPRTKRSASNNRSPNSCLNVLRFMMSVLPRSQFYEWEKRGQVCLTYARADGKSTRELMRWRDAHPAWIRSDSRVFDQDGDGGRFSALRFSGTQ